MDRPMSKKDLQNSLINNDEFWEHAPLEPWDRRFPEWEIIRQASDYGWDALSTWGHDLWRVSEHFPEEGFFWHRNDHRVAHYHKKGVKIYQGINAQDQEHIMDFLAFTYWKKYQFPEFQAFKDFQDVPYHWLGKPTETRMIQSVQTWNKAQRKKNRSA